MYRALNSAIHRKAIVRATGLLLGTWGLTYAVVSRPVYLDAAQAPRRSGSPEKDSFIRPGLITQSLVASQKPVASFDSYRKPDVDAKLREFEQVHKAPPGAGISEYHIAETTRSFYYLYFISY